MDPAILEGLRRRNAQLVQQNAELHQKVAKLTDQVEQLSREVLQLRKQLEQAEAASARQAAPFRRPERLKKPPGQHKKSGRPAGHRGAHRPAPPIDHHEVVPLPCCPNCGGPKSGDIYEQAGVKPVAGVFAGFPKHLFGVTGRGARSISSGRPQSQ